MTTRANAAEFINWAHSAFRRRVAGVRWFNLNLIAAATRMLASDVERFDKGKALAWRELADLLEVPSMPEPRPMRDPTVDRYSEPDEDDDKMRELRARVRT